MKLYEQRYSINTSVEEVMSHAQTNLSLGSVSEEETHNGALAGKSAGKELATHLLVKPLTRRCSPGLQASRPPSLLLLLFSSFSLLIF